MDLLITLVGIFLWLFVVIAILSMFRAVLPDHSAPVRTRFARLRRRLNPDDDPPAMA
jgi:hypothetical protein